MKASHKKAIAQLKKLAKDWPPDLMLFSWSGSLLAVETDNYEVLDTISGIPNDGGDPNNVTEDGRTYLEY